MESLFHKISIIGVGLLGGSVGMAALKRGLCKEVIGIGRTQTSLQEAIRQDAISDGTTNLEEGLAGAELVIISTPVSHILDILPQVVAACDPGAIITDVGSTKATIVARGDEVTQGTGRFFVGSHPMAGSEKSGVQHGRASLFEGSTCFVTRTDQTDSAALAKVFRLWKFLGARLVISRPERHDALTAMVSHLPHLAAVALVRTVEQFNEDRNLIRGIIGNGFRDTTRIAGGSPEMWEDICTDNRSQIQQARTALERSLAELMAACEAEPQCNRLRKMLDEAREFREFLAITRD